MRNYRMMTAAMIPFSRRGCNGLESGRRMNASHHQPKAPARLLLAFGRTEEPSLALRVGVYERTSPGVEDPGYSRGMIVNLLQNALMRLQPRHGL
jgi:hypothetical protein